MAVLLASAYALSITGLMTLGVLIKELRNYTDAPPLLSRLAVATAVFGGLSVTLRVVAYVT